MKCLFLAPLRYPFIRSVTAGMDAMGIAYKALDYQDLFDPRINRLHNGYTALPRKVRRLWEEPYVRKVNEAYLQAFQEYGPDLVLIYNDQLILPETLRVIKAKSRIAFFLGDNPLYTPTNIHNLAILFLADHVIVPDTLWRQQLHRMGIANVHFDCFGINEAAYHPVVVTDEQRRQYGADLVYIGSASKTNWGFKRALFLDRFSGLDLKAYISGDGMERWYSAFPALEAKVVHHDRFDTAFNNLVYNCGKVAPVEQVPSLFHGVHVRVFDALGAGILPLCEESQDLDEVFSGLDVPMIRDYREAAALATHWVQATDDRQTLVARMREIAMERYAPGLVIRRMMDQLFPSWH